MEGDEVFGKRKGQKTKIGKPSKTKEDVPQAERLMRLDFEMMLRGNVIDRPEGKVRQIGVTVDGSTKVVTSGDLINRETYKALIQVGAIQPNTAKGRPEEKPEG